MRHFKSMIMAGLLLPAGGALAQQFSHYIPGTEGILAGTLPGPGIYVDDLNFVEQNRSSGYIRLYSHYLVDEKEITYINEPRLRWVSPYHVLGANYGLEVIVPWECEQQKVSSPPPFASESTGQFSVLDAEVSPLLLSWHWRQFDARAAYAFWVPTDGNSFNTQPSHWWANMFTVGGTWYIDADKNWAVSSLNNYEVNEPFNISSGPEASKPGGSQRLGQTFTTEFGLSRKVGKYFELGFIGNYSKQVTSNHVTSRIYYSNSGYPGTNVLTGYYNFNNPTLWSMAVGPEIKFKLPGDGFTASIRYLRELNNPLDVSGSYTDNEFVLSLSKQF